MAEKREDKKPEDKPVQCPVCSGRGTVAFGDQDVECSNCGGKGTVKG